MRDILVLCPQERDLTAIRAAGLEDRYRIHFEGSDLDQLDGLRPGTVPRRGCGRFRPTASSARRTSRLCSRRCSRERRGLPGPTPHALLALQHKPTSRERQRARRARGDAGVRSARRAAALRPAVLREAGGRPAVPERLPDRRSERPPRPARGGQLHEPVRAHRGAGRCRPEARCTASWREELLAGDEVTLEGYVSGESVTTIGVTDSIKYPGTFSFQRFEYPSTALGGAAGRALGGRLSGAARARVRRRLLQRRVLRPREGAGADHRGERADRLAVRAARPERSTAARPTTRSSSSPAATIPPGRPASPTASPSATCTRVFEDAFVEAVPDPEEGLEVLVRPGLFLSEQGDERRPELPARDPLRLRARRGRGSRTLPRACRVAQLPAGAGACALTSRRRREPLCWRCRRRRPRRPRRRAPRRRACRPGRRRSKLHGVRDCAGPSPGDRTGCVDAGVEDERDDEADDGDGHEAAEA